MSKENIKHIFEQFKMVSKTSDIRMFPKSEKNPHVWHVVFKGADDTDFAGGIYHAEMDLSEYPFKAPRIRLTNKNGSAIPMENLCIVGITHYH